MKILVTGSSGFIGSAFCNHIAKQRNDIQLIEVSRANGFDLSKAGWAQSLPADGSDVVVHLAQSNRYRDFPEGVMDVFDVNVRSTLELLEWSRLHGVKRFLLASTGSLYKGQNVLLTEDGEVCASSFYAASKLSAEQMTSQYSQYFEVVVLRIFSVYGPGQANMMIPKLIDAVLEGRDVHLVGGKGVYLTPLYIDDAVRFLVCLLDIPLEQAVEVFNLSGNETISFADLLELVERLTGRQAIRSVTAGNPVFAAASNRKLLARTRLNCLTGMEFGLKIMLEYVR